MANQIPTGGASQSVYSYLTKAGLTGFGPIAGLPTTPKTEGWLAIPALLLAAGSLYQRELHVFLHVRTTFQTAGAYCPSRNHPRDVVAHPDNGHVAAAFSRNYSSP
jgi:hypothetical protein